MPNPLAAVWDYLRGADLQPSRTPLPAPTTKTQPVVEQKLYYNTDVGAAIRLGTLVHGPGASELLGMAAGAGQAANSAVFACLSTVCTAYTEAQPRVYRLPADGGTPEVLPEHPLEVLLDEPNPALTGIELRWWTQWALKVDGNAYWHKARAGDGATGNVVALWPRSPGTIAPITTKDDRQRGVFVSFYRWEYETGKYQDIPPENIVHFRAGLDDYDMRLGCSALKRLLREVSTDEEATKFTDALLKNYAVPGLVAQTQADLDEATADAIKQKLSTKFGSGNQGNVAVLDNGMTMQQFGFSPQQMDMKTLHRVPEERIAAVIGVPAIVAGLGAGLDRATYSNFAEAREMFTEQNILPLYVADAAVINRHLKPDFTRDRRLAVQFDLTQLRALQEDMDKQYARLTAAVQAKWIAPNEARAQVGLPPIDGGDSIQPAAAPSLPDGGNQNDGESAQNGATGRGRLRLVGGSKASAIRPQLTPQDFPELFDALRALAEPALTDELDAYLDGQQRRIKARLLADATDSGTADPDTARAALPRAAGAGR